MEGQTVQALIDALEKCDPDKLVLVRCAHALFEPVDVEETPENVYLEVE